MSGRRVHAVVAAGLADPRHLARWARDPDSLAAHGVDPAALDVAALRKFAGLTTIVRHNGLRHDFPLTFKLLSTCGMEIDLFADYASDCADRQRRLAPVPAQRARDLETFIAGWIDRADPDHLLLHDIVRHEAALLLVKEPGPAASELSALPDSGVGPGDVPVVRGTLILRAYSSDPRAIAAALRKAPTILASVEPTGAKLGYWRASPEDPVRCVDLDDFSYELLSRADGVLPVAALARRLIGEEPTAPFLAAVAQLCDIGLIDLGRPAGADA